APLSPAAKLGADKILAIGVRANELEEINEPARNYPSLASIGGTLLNAIFLDSLDGDFENLDRINKLLANNKPNARYKPIQTFFMRPSQDLGGMAFQFANEIPRTVRHFT